MRTRFATAVVVAAVMVASLGPTTDAQRVQIPSQRAVNPYAPVVATPYGGVVQQTLPGTAPAYVPQAPMWDSYNCQPNACAPTYQVTPVIAEPVGSWHFFGEFLFLRPNDAAMVSYALPVNGLFPPPPTPAPAGPVAIIDPGYEPGFRVGGGFAWSGASELMATYTRYESDASSSLMVAPPSPNVILPLVFHPATLAAGSVFTTASASGNVTMNLVDIDYRRTLADNWLRTSYYIGGRYVNLDQTFSARFSGGVAPGPAMQNVGTRIDFDGGGVRMGLTADLATPNSGLFGYANGFASFIAGEFKSSFRQTDGAAMPIVIATTSRTDDRVVPILDLELGVGWQSQSGAWRFTAGYLFSAWLNVVSTDEFIRAAHTAQFGSLSDTLTFDGLTARVDWRF